VRSPTPHRKPPSRVVAVGLASALTLAACGASGDVDAVADLQMADRQLDAAATDTTLASTIPPVRAIDDVDQATTDDGALQAPGLPVASDEVEAAPIAGVEDASGDDSVADSTATAQDSVTTTAPTTAVTTAVSETTVAPATQPTSTMQAQTTSPPVAASLPNLPVIDLVSGSSVGFPQAAQANGLPVVLWFWSPT